MRHIGWRFIPIIVFIILCGFLWRGLFLNPKHLPSVQIGKSLPAFNLSQLPNTTATFSSANLPKQVALINVWASWCQACVEEQVLLLQLARQGVVIYGINYKDRAADATAWLEQWGNPYKIIGQDVDGKLAIDLGVYGAPETFVLDKQGIIRYRHVGILQAQDWALTIEPMLKRLEQQS